MPKKVKAVRYGAAKRKREQMTGKWQLFVDHDNHDNLESVVGKLNVAELEKLDEVLNSVYQYEHRLRKQREKMADEK